MKKVVLKVDVHDDRTKQKIMKAVSTLPGIDSIAVDMKESKMTVIGSVDPIEIVTKLKKHHCHCDILTVGPPADPKKGDEKKPDPKKEAEKKKEANQQQAQMFHPYTVGYNYEPYPYMAQPSYNHPHNLNYNYRLVSPDENPNGCVIC